MPEIAASQHREVPSFWEDFRQYHVIFSVLYYKKLYKPLMHFKNNFPGKYNIFRAVYRAVKKDMDLFSQIQLSKGLVFCKVLYILSHRASVQPIRYYENAV